MSEDMLAIGDKAPDFELKAQTGETVQLSSFAGRKNVVLFFYPKDDTPGCTKEACSFRDNYADFVDRDTVVLGVSADSGESHQRFASKYGLPFPLLSDSSGGLRKLYGVSRTWGIMPGRVTFVIDKQGVIRGVFSAPFQFEEHVQAALAALQ